ncbi:LysR substrate-binding domain-containing protein [Mitsuaria sp. GD03876]|uniref:LysR substrate-binding domain-containing protein n=1 Tax=Mitsuaria sp. GD03876 TaxID=2975399 RepID=UPI00244AF2B4|nr:LysR substrate-binding domain-containing protein [Mitsuaria sp. GD03876]MDH0863342.1 LysR substrate-binding domain-containing protein [Mitsuaria sp. GD03876]
MNAFVRVVEAGNFTKAAESLALPNASVTRLIQSLEQDLKVLLLHRTTRAVTVTPEGASYYERVVRLLADLADIETSTRHSSAKPAGRVQVDAPPAIASMVLVPALREFHRAYPDVKVDLGVGNRRTDLVAEGVDCVIRAGEVSEQFLVARRIGGFRFATCATPGFLDEHGTPTSPEQIPVYPTVGLAGGPGGRVQPFRFSLGEVEHRFTLDHALVVDDTNAYLAAGLAGLGLIQAPCYTVDTAVLDGRLVSLLDAWHPNEIPVHVLYAPNRYLSAKVRVFIDWVVTVFERHEHLRRV